MTVATLLGQDSSAWKPINIKLYFHQLMITLSLQMIFVLSTFIELAT